jgi:hypothetical protein
MAGTERNCLKLHAHQQYIHNTTKQGGGTPAKSPLFFPSIPKEKFEGRSMSTYMVFDILYFWAVLLRKITFSGFLCSIYVI